MTHRVELQLEVDASRDTVFALFATEIGLRQWLDAADLEPRVGGALRVRMRDASATGKVLAIDAPQHISYTWEWTGSGATHPMVVAFDAIDHGTRTHVTLRHTGLRTQAQLDLHNELWRYWLERFAQAVRDPAGPAPHEVVPG
ncbi:MAG: SRPBCC domain-containing protein [Chloroflexota bacterium]